MTIKNDGNIGFGTSSPAQKLNIVSGTADIRFGNPNSADGIDIRSGAVGDSPAIFLTHTGTNGRTYRMASFGDNTNPGMFVIRDESTCVGVDRLRLDGYGRLTSRFGDPCFSSIGEPSGGLTFNRQFSSHFSGLSVEALGALNASDAGGMINVGINTGREGPFNTAYNGYWLRADSRLNSRGFYFFKKAAPGGAESLLLTINDSGNVGIGTGAPEQTLHVNGLEILSTGASSGFKFRDRGSTSSADDWVWYSNGNVARLFRAGVGDLLTVTTGGVLTVNALGAAGSTSLCRNALNQISTCTAGNLVETTAAENAAAVGALAEKNAQMDEELKRQQLLIDELKGIVCSLKPDALLCKETSK